ncbi:MCE family protein [Rhodococcus sp. SGAir0479]|nr:MCE family protein [Rhodococcus sp. SGAir0479]QCQ93363.1 MCE family protein [Rhodococcus sp. SGAir0479]
MSGRHTARRRVGRVAIAAVLVAVVAAGSWFVFGRTDRATTVHVDFAYVNGLYPGSKVTVLGVPVGTVTGVEPRGTHVRVTATVPADVVLPAEIQAYVLNPSVISDRHLEFGPAYRGGPRLGDGAVIPVERSHAPIDFDGLMGSLGTLTEALGADGGDVGALLSQAASGLDGQGPEIGRALRNLGAATGVVAARGDDIGALVDNLDSLMTALDVRQVSIDQLVSDLGALGDEWSAHELDIAGPLQDLKTVFDRMDRFTSEHGDDVGAVADNLRTLGETLTARQPGLAEFMDLVPLLMQNLSRTVGPDDRGRIRLNVSTALTQFAVAQPLCAQYPMPLCTGAGFTNPVSFPVSAADPLGLATVLSGGAVPAGGR